MASDDLPFLRGQRTGLVEDLSWYSKLANVVDSTQVASLPLNGRNIYQLTALVPGVFFVRQTSGIDDTFTAYLMGQFYAYLSRGSDAGTALAQAKRDAIHTYGNSGLQLWAGFQLVGNGDETMERGGGL